MSSMTRKKTQTRNDYTETVNTDGELNFLGVWYNYAPKDLRYALVQQFEYVPGRKFKADFAHPASHVLIEYQGGVTNRRAHGSVTGILRDIQRLNFASENGWFMFRVWAGMLEDYEAAAEFVAQVVRTIRKNGG